MTLIAGIATLCRYLKKAGILAESIPSGQAISDLLCFAYAVSMSFAVYVPVGPSPDEVERLADLLDSIFTFRAGLKWVILVDDSEKGRDLAAIVDVPPEVRLTVLRNPRNGSGDGHAGGLCVANLVAFEWLLHHTEAEFLLKLDTDSLILGQVFDILLAVTAKPSVGLVGVIGDSFTVKRAHTGAVKNASLFRQLLSNRELNTTSERPLISRRLAGPHVQELRTLVSKVAETGRPLGVYCQGGGYAVSRQLVRNIASLGHLENPLIWRDVKIGEDVVIGLYCAASGLELKDLSGPGELFAVDPNPLQLSGEELLGLGAKVIHSVKGSHEAALRQFFCAHRRSSENASSRP